LKAGIEFAYLGSSEAVTVVDEVIPDLHPMGGWRQG
jgi:hypothetical protein